MTRRSTLFSLVVLATLLTTMVGLPFAWEESSVRAEGEPAFSVASDPVPQNAIRVCADCTENDLQATIDAAPEGAVIVVEGGQWEPITVNKPIRLVGQNWPLIDAHTKGTGIRIDSSDVTVEGFDIRNTGHSFDKEDSGIYFEGQRNRILNNRMSEVLFGINGATGHDSEIAGNYISGRSGVSEGLRGDGIKVWYSHRVQIHHNHVIRSRDSLVWYSNEAHVYENLITDSRYGFHFMNSDDGLADRNRLIDNSVGIYLMYGKRFTVNDNLLQGSRGPSGHGLGLKEVDGIEASGNIIYDNRIGIYNDNSPFSMNAQGLFRDNLIAFNDSGIGILPSSRSNTYFGNSFVENLEQVTVLGGGKLGDSMMWSQNGVGNYWSDYTGYDASGDGIGDIPYEHASLSEQLRRTHPQLQLFRFSLAETAIDFASQAVPLFKTHPVLVDPAPLVKPTVPANAPRIEQDVSFVRTASISGALISGVALTMWWATRPIRAAAAHAESA